MRESERHERMIDNRYLEDHEKASRDEELALRIQSFLNHPQIDEFCMVDAYYYDLCEIPDAVRGAHNIWCDCYMIFGITTEGEMITKWVDRWDLDSNDPIVDGKIMKREKKDDSHYITGINELFNFNLLTAPIPGFINIFREKIK